MIIKKVGSANYKKEQEARYKFIKSFSNVKELIAAVLRKVKESQKHKESD